MNSTRPASGFRPDIQGLRAVAVLLVVLYHSGVPFLTGGFIGVDVFFVVSGFLITTHILESLSASTFTFSSFYARRVRRILPASLAVLGLSLVVAWLVLPPLQLARVSRDAAWTALYAPNLLFAREGTNYLAAPEPSLFQHYWSLGIEEQFYLIWPLLLWALYRLTRRRIDVLMWVVVGLVLVSFVGGVLLTEQNQPWAFFLLPTRAWELGIGGIVAFILRRWQPDLRPILRGSVAGAGLILLIGSAFVYDHSTPFPSYYAAVPVLATAAVILVGPSEGLVGAVLQNRVALWIGAISYSVYLVHWPLLILPEAASSWMRPLELWQSLVLGALSLPLGWLSYRFIETPFRRPRAGRRQLTWTPLVAAVGCGVLIAAVSFAGMRAVPAMQLDTGRDAPPFEVSPHPASAPFIGSNLNVRLQDAQSEMAVPSGKGCDLSMTSAAPPAACTYGPDPSALSVALVGDSHAAQWAPGFEAIANSGEIFLTAHTKSACSLHDRSSSADVQETPVCRDWKQATLALLERDAPDVIVLTHSIMSKPISASAYEQSMRELLAELPEESQVVLLRDTPRFSGDPVSCLSSHLESPSDCSISRELGLDTAFSAVDDALSTEGRVSRMDLTDYMCAETCPVVQGDVLVFKDHQHISRTFSCEMAPALLTELREAVPNVSL